MIEVGDSLEVWLVPHALCGGCGAQLAIKRWRFPQRHLDMFCQSDTCPRVNLVLAVSMQFVKSAVTGMYDGS